MALTLARQYADEPWRGYGAGPPQVFARLRSGMAWHEAAAGMFGGSGSYGNGAAMRVAPIALFAHPDTERVAHLAHQSSLITHTHPERIDGAVAQAVAIDRILAGESDPGPLVETLSGYMKAHAFRRALSEVPLAVEEQADFAHLLGNGVRPETWSPPRWRAFSLPTPFGE